MAWWRGQYIVALVRLRSHDGSLTHAVKLFGANTLDDTACLCEAIMPEGVHPTKVAVGITHSLGPDGIPKPLTWIIVSGDLVSGSPEGHLSPVSADPSSEHHTLRPVGKQLSAVHLGEAHTPLWSTASCGSHNASPVLMVYRLKLTAKDVTAESVAKKNFPAAALLLQTNVLLPQAARHPTVVAVLQGPSASSDAAPSPNILVLTRDSNLVCVALSEGSQLLIAPNVYRFWIMTDVVFGGHGQTEIVYFLTSSGVHVWCPAVDRHADQCIAIGPDPVIKLNSEAYPLGEGPSPVFGVSCWAHDVLL